MAKLQYRELGTGEYALYKKTWIGYWRKIEVTDYRLYKIEGELNDCVAKMKKLFKEHEEQLNIVNKAKGLVKNSKQDNPYRSDPFEDSIPKGSKKFRKSRARPVNFWASVRNAILNATDLSAIYSDPVRGSDSPEPERTGTVNQDIGKPVRQNQSRKQKNQQQNNHQNH